MGALCTKSLTMVKRMLINSIQLMLPTMGLGQIYKLQMDDKAKRFEGP
ncbi:hypothetical protein Hanom_Chr14g01252131 [Helianthus anomalus]